MRKEDQEIAEAFKAGRRKSMARTMTDGEGVWLHGNCIAKRDGAALLVTLAGWATNTTCARVNAILETCGTASRIYRKDRSPVLRERGEDRPISASEWLRFEDVFA